MMYVVAFGLLGYVIIVGLDEIYKTKSKHVCKIFGHALMFSKMRWFPDINQHQYSPYCKRCERFVNHDD
jgi:hypothetical protein